MLDQLVDSPVLLAAAIAGTSIVGYLVNLATARAFALQSFVEREQWHPPGIAGKARSDATQLARPFAGTAAIILLTLFMAPWGRELIGAGWLAMQLVVLGSNVADLLTVQGLLRPAAAEGRLRYSAAHHYRTGAARLVGGAIIAGVVALLFNNVSFLVGMALLLATSVGWYRRARQAAASPRQ